MAITIILHTGQQLKDQETLWLSHHIEQVRKGLYPNLPR
jgi:hypothetical protein